MIGSIMSLELGGGRSYLYRASVKKDGCQGEIGGWEREGRVLPTSDRDERKRKNRTEEGSRGGKASDGKKMVGLRRFLAG